MGRWRGCVIFGTTFGDSDPMNFNIWRFETHLTTWIMEKTDFIGWTES
jgi:hypothetical protein